MRNYTRYLLIVALATIAFTSCRKSASKQAKYVPKESNFVAAINAKSLVKKLYEGNFTLDSFYASVNDSASKAEMKTNISKMEELKDAGIDWNSDVLAFAAQKGSMLQGQQSTWGAVALLSDAAKLQAYLTKQKKDLKVVNGGDYSYAVVDHNAIVGWNKEVAVFLGGNGSPSYQTDTVGGGSSVPVDSYDPVQDLATIMKLKSDASVGSIDIFNDLLKDKSDAKFFTNNAASVDAIPMMGMTKISDLLKDSYSAGTMDFQDGKIVGNWTTYSNKEFANIIEKNSKGDADLDMVDMYPGKPNVFAAFSFNPQLLVDILKFIGLEKTANDFLANNMKMTVSEMLQAFGGDFAIVFSDFAESSKIDSTMMSAAPDFKYVFNAKVGDKNAFEKLMTKLEQNKMVTKRGDGYALASPSVMQTATSFNAQNMIFASDSVLLVQYKGATKKDNIASDVRDKVKGKPGALYIDFASIMNSMTDTSAAFQTAKNTFRDMIITGDHIKGKETKSEMQVRFVNEKENSITSLLRWASKMAAQPKMKLHHADWADEIDSADVIAPPIPSKNL
jgi:hypothetical protein